MATTLVVVRNRVRARLNELDNRAVSTGLIAIDNAIADTLQVQSARLPAPKLYSASAFNISAGAQTFALPTTLGVVATLEYAGDVRLQLNSDKTFLLKSTRDEIEALRFGDTSTAGSKPLRFSLYEDSATVVQGECWPRSKDLEAVNLFASLDHSDVRDAASMDAAEIQFSRFGVTSLVLMTAAVLVRGMADEDLALRRLERAVAATWEKQAASLLYTDERRRHDAEGSGRTQRWIP
jgi:hypothetical protein